MALVGLVLVTAGKVKRFQPAVSAMQKVVKAPTWE
jgi:hypothetical protein